jgi:nucleoid-associated protein YgaU
MTGPVKAYLQPEKGGRITFLFNPSELTISKSNSWQGKEAKGKNAPQQRFQSGQAATLSMSITLDTTLSGTDVAVHTGRLLHLMAVDQSLPGGQKGRNAGRPPWVQFHWGKLRSFKAVLEKVQVKFTYFASDGTPLRAKADLTLKQWHDEVSDLPLQNPTSGTLETHTVHVLTPGETLDRVAAAHYGDATRWRLIARANDIVDPFAVPAGTVLVVPEPEVRHRA